MHTLGESALNTFTHLVGGKDETYPLLSYRDRAKILAKAASAEREAFVRDAKMAGLSPSEIVARLREMSRQYMGDNAFVAYINGRLFVPQDEARTACLVYLLDKRTPGRDEDELVGEADALGVDGWDVLLKAAGLRMAPVDEEPPDPLAEGAGTTTNPPETGNG